MSDQAYALAAVLEAKHAAPTATRVPLEDVRALLASLAKLPTPPGTERGRAELLERATTALTLPQVAAGTPALTEAIRRAIESSGMFFEGRLAAMFARGATAPEAGALRDDLRAVLVDLASLTSGSQALEETRARLTADVLARQVDVAYHKVKDDELRLDVPVMMGESPTDVHMRVRDERATPEEETPSGRQVEVSLELPEFGRVRTSITWTPGHLTTRFAVEGADQARVLQSGFDALNARLQAVGFRHVTLSVDVDPGTLVVDDGPEPELPGGSILHVRA